MYWLDGGGVKLKNALARTSTRVRRLATGTPATDGTDQGPAVAVSRPTTART